jgi:lipoprotein-releasing system ATP-binding protein
VIDATNIRKSYGTLEVLRGVHIHVRQGEIAALLGQSGSGKSTLLHILGALDVPDTGTIKINGIDLPTLKGRSLSAFRNEQIGFIFQFHHLLPEFTALENVMIPGLIRKEHPDKVRAHAMENLDYLGLSDRLQHKPGQLSGGEQQRVAVARALQNSPAVILADEPTGNLDTANSAEMHALFKRLRADFGHTFLIATHSQELAAICDTRYHIRDGVLHDIKP